MLRFGLLLMLVPHSRQYSVSQNYNSANTPENDEMYTDDDYQYGYGEDVYSDTHGYSLAVASVKLHPSTVKLPQKHTDPFATVQVSLGLVDPLAEDHSFSVIFVGPRSQVGSLHRYPDAATSEDDLFSNGDVVLECHLTRSVVHMTDTTSRGDATEDETLSWYQGEVRWGMIVTVRDVVRLILIVQCSV